MIGDVDDLAAGSLAGRPGNARSGFYGEIAHDACPPRLLDANLPRV
jgi:hypothetical protein